MLSVLCASFSIGCGGDGLGRNAISGTVNVDGAPLGKGTINFQPVEQGITSSGGKITDGKYALTEENGLPPGKYRVMINAPVPGTGGEVPEGTMPGDPVPVAQEMIPADWNLNSKQEIEVKADGPFEFNFDIPTKGKS